MRSLFHTPRFILIQRVRRHWYRAVPRKQQNESFLRTKTTDTGRLDSPVPASLVRFRRVASVAAWRRLLSGSSVIVVARRGHFLFRTAFVWLDVAAFGVTGCLLALVLVWNATELLKTGWSRGSPKLTCAWNRTKTGPNVPQKAESRTGGGATISGARHAGDTINQIFTYVTRNSNFYT